MRKDIRQYVEERVKNKENRKLIQEFMDHSVAAGKSPARIERYIDAIVPLSNTIGKPFKEITRDDMEKYVRGFFENFDYTDSTIHGYQVTIKNCFFPWLYGTERPEYPEVVKWMKPKKPKIIKMPEDMITEEEAERMIEASNSERDKALVSLLFESGARIGEIMNMKVGDIQFNGEVTHVTLNGKTGIRKIPIVKSGTYLKNWLVQHPGGNNPKSSVFYNRRRKGFRKCTTYFGFHYTLRRIARKANVKKRVNPHNFRHSQATLLASKLSEQLLKMYFGWSGDSRMAATYVHMSSNQLTEAILEAHRADKTEQNKGSNNEQFIQTIRDIIREEIRDALGTSSRLNIAF